MAILQALLAMLLRSMGKIVNTVFGWASVMLFGKVPQSRQMVLSIMALAALVWFLVLLSVLFPRVGVFLLSFVILPDWVNANYVRLAMLGSAALLPMAVGVLSLYVVGPEARPKGWQAKAKAILKGYPYALGIAVTFTAMMILTPLLKARDLIMRWTTMHVPIIVESRHYMDVVADIQRTLRRHGVETHRVPASWMLRLPTRLLSFFAGGAAENIVASQLTVLKSPQLEVLLHPSDLVIRGRPHDVARVRALITEHLCFTNAYQTWSKEANQVEDKLTKIWRNLQAHSTDEGPDDATPDEALASLRSCEQELKTLNIPFEEWAVLFQEKLVVENAILRWAAGITEKPAEMAHASSAAET